MYELIVKANINVTGTTITNILNNINLYSKLKFRENVLTFSIERFITTKISTPSIFT